MWTEHQAGRRDHSHQLWALMMLELWHRQFLDGGDEEAMAMGRPVIGSNVGGLAELIEDGVTGVLFTAESRGSFVEAADALGRDPAARTQMGARAREAMLRQRTWDQIVRHYLPVYQSVA